MDKKISRRSNFASHGCSNSVNNSTNSGSSKRDPFRELTNSLIPTEVLLDLCSNSLSASKAQDLLRRSQTSTFSVSKNLRNSKSDSKSDTSIGSSSFNQFRDAQNPTSVRRPHLSGSSSATPGNEGHKLKVYSRRQTLENSEQARRIDSNLENSEHARRIDSNLVSSGPVKKNMKDEERVIPVHMNTTPSYKAKNKRAVVATPIELIHSVKEGANEKDIAVPLISTCVEKVKDKGNTTVGSGSCTPAEKSKDKGKSIAVPFSPTAEKAMSVAAPKSHLNEQAKDEEMSTAMLSNHPISKKIRRNVRAAISSCPPLTRSIRDKRNEVDHVKQSKAWSEPHPKKKKTRYSAQQAVSDYSLTQELEKQKAYFQEIDAFELPVEEVSGVDLD